jgi:hypothetical protein
MRGHLVSIQLILVLLSAPAFAQEPESYQTRGAIRGFLGLPDGLGIQLQLHLGPLALEASGGTLLLLTRGSVAIGLQPRIGQAPSATRQWEVRSGLFAQAGYQHVVGIMTSSFGSPTVGGTLRVSFTRWSGTTPRISIELAAGASCNWSSSGPYVLPEARFAFGRAF